MDELRKTIVTAVNNSQLPIDAIFYVMKDIWRDIYEMHENALKTKEETPAEEESKEEE